MNKLTIIGNLTHSPDLRSVKTATGEANVCDFSVAVNGRKGEDAIFFRCTAWRGLADVIAKYAEKGTKVCVTGPVSLRQYTGKDGSAKASLEVTVEDFEFCGSRRDSAPQEEPPQEAPKKDSGMTVVDDPDLPF